MFIEALHKVFNNTALFMHGKSFFMDGWHLWFWIFYQVIYKLLCVLWYPFNFQTIASFNIETVSTFREKFSSTTITLHQLLTITGFLYFSDFLSACMSQSHFGNEWDYMLSEVCATPHTPVIGYSYYLSFLSLHKFTSNAFRLYNTLSYF